MIELKPCPFCGSENLTLLKPIPGFATSFVRCNSCRAFGPDSDNTDQAAKAWNNRRGEKNVRYV